MQINLDDGAKSGKYPAVEVVEEEHQPEDVGGIAASAGGRARRDGLRWRRGIAHNALLCLRPHGLREKCTFGAELYVLSDDESMWVPGRMRPHSNMTTTTPQARHGALKTVAEKQEEIGLLLPLRAEFYMLCFM